ncbi:hypothetical protein ACFPRA_01165 [Sporosarcina soli]|uniref:Uncharacterized protein n=1 Tax=Sporosarcina soli TaxID=334736 RepID=A0ABW0TFY2_9BACL
MQQSLVYPFVLNMWMMKRINELFIRGQAKLGRLKEDEVDLILATPQNIR